MSEVTVELPSWSDWTSEEATIAGATGTTVIYGPPQPLMPHSSAVYKHTVQIQLLPHAAHEWPVAMELLEQMCTAAVANPWSGVLKFLCYVSRDGRKGVIITEEIVFTDPEDINTLKGMAEHDAFVAWLTEGDNSGRAKWTVSDTPVPASFA